MRRLGQRALKDIWNNRFLTAIAVITIALSVLIAATFTLFYINAGTALNLWKNDIRMMVYLKPDASASDQQETQRQLKLIPELQRVDFIAKDTALARLKEQMPNQLDLLENLVTNPLPDAFEIAIDPAAVTSAQVAAIASRIKGISTIEEVAYSQQWIDRFATAIHLFRLAGYAMGSLFFLVTTFIIANTIRLMLYARREEMEIMRLVGATDGFIKLPFYLEGMILGGVGACLGLAALYLGYHGWLTHSSALVTNAFFTLRFFDPEPCAALLFSGVLIGWIGSFISLKQFLKV